MRILEPSQRTATRRPRARLAAVLIAWSALAFAMGAATQATGFWGTVVRPALQAGTAAPGRWLRARLATPVRVELDIKFEAFQKLEHQRERALAERALFASEDDFVNGVIRTGDQEQKVKLRLKGDSAAHLQGDKWSFRVDVKGDDTLFGMKRFSLQDPSTRNYLTEWTFHRALAREDVLSLRYEFVDLTLNGKHLGIYAIEEHFEKQLIEHNRRREGPLLRFNEDLMWREAHHQTRPFLDAQTSGYGAYEASAVDGFKTGQALGDEAARARYQKAAQLLEEFRRGTLSTSAVFDTKRLATFFALTDLFGAEHGARWHNLRFYFNPVTSRLEPIGFDAECRPTTVLSGIQARMHDARTGRLRVLVRPLNDRVFEDRAFQALYLAELERISQPAYLDRLLADLASPMEAALAILHREFLQLETPEALLRRNQAYLRSMLEPVGGVRAALASAVKDSITLDVGNLQAMPIELVSVEFASEGGAPASEIALKPPVSLPPRKFGDLMQFSSVSVARPSGAEAVQPPGMRIRWRIPGTQRTATETVELVSPLAHGVVSLDVTQQLPNLASFPFIQLDADGSTASIRAGQWVVSEDLIVPPGIVLRAGPGTRLDLQKGAKIFSRSPLEWSGSADAPIELVSTDDSGEGLVVVQAGAPSTFRHVRFHGLHAADAESYTLTGALTFYESPVEFSACEFAANQSEDALNVFRGRVTITDSEFSETKSDAFDCDFCEGEITNTRFRALGNDAIDVSGADMRVDGIVVDGARDKGLSVGEGSHLIASRVVVTGANVGLASKDKGTLIASDVTLRRCRYALVALVKKAEFGGSELTVTGLRTEEMEVRNLIDASSRVSVDGVALAPTGEQKEIWELLYGENAPGRSIR